MSSSNYAKLLDNGLKEKESLSLHQLAGYISILISIILLIVVLRNETLYNNKEYSDQQKVYFLMRTIIFVGIILTNITFQARYIKKASNLINRDLLINTLEFENRTLNKTKDILIEKISKVDSEILPNCNNHLNLTQQDQTEDTGGDLPSQDDVLAAGGNCTKGSERVQLPLSSCQFFGDDNICNVSACVGNVCEMDSFITNINDCQNITSCDISKCSVQSDGITYYCPPSFAFDQDGGTRVTQETCDIMNQTDTDVINGNSLKFCDDQDCVQQTNSEGESVMMCKLIPPNVTELTCQTMEGCKLSDCVKDENGKIVYCPYHKFSCDNFCGGMTREDRIANYNAKLESIDIRLIEIEKEILELNNGFNNMDLFGSFATTFINILGIVFMSFSTKKKDSINITALSISYISIITYFILISINIYKEKTIYQ